MTLKINTKIKSRANEYSVVKCFPGKMWKPDPGNAGLVSFVLQDKHKSVILCCHHMNPNHNSSTHAAGSPPDVGGHLGESAGIFVSNLGNLEQRKPQCRICNFK